MKTIIKIFLALMLVLSLGYYANADSYTQCKIDRVIAQRQARDIAEQLDYTVMFLNDSMSLVVNLFNVEDNIQFLYLLDEWNALRDEIQAYFIYTSR